jgi:ABC-type antimicrobial peptide transport system permease subunit
MEEILRESLARQRLQARLLAAFAALALVLAAVGLYGLMAFSVASRSREIGIRVAVGAGPADIVRLVLRELGRLLAAGLAIGSLAGLVAGRLMRSLLHGIPVADPPSFAAAAFTLSLAALAASLVPVRRALRTDPATSLRSE